MRQSLKGKRMVPVDEALECIDSPALGHVEAVLTAMRRLKLPELLHAEPSRERDLTFADEDQQAKARRDPGGTRTTRE